MLGFFFWTVLFVWTGDVMVPWWTLRGNIASSIPDGDFYFFWSMACSFFFGATGCATRVGEPFACAVDV